MPDIKWLAGIVALLLAAMPAPGSADAAVDAALAPLGFLAGHCWVTEMSESKTDTHCFEWMHGGQQLRDRHVVRGNGPDYLGETVYAYNGERKRVEYRYWNSLGGLSDGYVEAAADGVIRFLDDRYIAPDGAIHIFASEMTRTADGHYRMVSRYQDSGTWKEMWSRDFNRQE